MARVGVDYLGDHTAADTAAPPSSAGTRAIGSHQPIVFINQVETELEAQVRLLDNTLLTYNSLARGAPAKDDLHAVKVRLRQGDAIWLHVSVRPEHLVSIKWLTQLCRTAHRAGITWTMTCWLDDPWACAQLDGLRKIPGAATFVKQLGEQEATWITSSGLAQEVCDYSGFATLIKNSARRAMPLKWSGVHLATDPMRSTDDARDCKRQRAREDDDTLGGLRTPHRSVHKLRGAAACSVKLQSTIDDYISTREDVLLDHLSTLGKTTIPTELRDAAAEIREALIKVFNCERTPMRGLQGTLLQAIACELGDQDTEAIRWLTTGSTPLGIEKSIVPCNVFPLAEPAKAATAVDEWYNDDNYASFAEHREGAERILEHERDQGWLTWASTRAELERRFGTITTSRIGVIAKVKNHVEKLRLIHDLKRSGVNSRVTMHERIVLPRLRDLIDDILWAISTLQEDEDWETLVLDYADAFKQLVVDEAERRHLGGRALSGYFVYNVVLFGVRSGPLLWGRVAALLMRITATMNHRDRARLECYVDDPILVVAGTLLVRRRIMLRTILLWLALGAELSWQKGNLGREVEWIGAYLRHWLSPTGVRGATVGITPDRVRKLRDICDQLLNGDTRLHKARVRPLAGLATWMAGLMPQLNAFTRMLWAALSQDTASEHVHLKQIRIPLNWLRAFTEANMTPIERRCRLQPAYYTVITFDGSLSGGGAVLQTGVRDIHRATEAPIITYWTEAWQREDFELMQVAQGDSAGQARWEAFTLLQCVASWRELLTTAQGRLVILGDALGVLCDAVKFRAKDAKLNEVMAELALLVAPMGHELEAAHIWSERNSTCDALSRLTAGGQLPERLQSVRRTRRRPLDYAILRRAGTKWGKLHQRLRLLIT